MIKMDEFNQFIIETYRPSPKKWITYKTIYDDFVSWISEKHGRKLANGIRQKEIYDILKNYPDFPSKRMASGLCLKGITHKMDEIVAADPVISTLVTDDKMCIQNKSLNLQIVPDISKKRTPPRCRGLIYPVVPSRTEIIYIENQATTQ